MATLTQQKPCVTSNASSSYFASYSGTYYFDFSSTLPSNAIVSSVTFTANTHYLQTSMNGTYYIALLSSSSDTTGSVGSDILTFSHTSSSTQKSLSGTVWTANSTITNQIGTAFYARIMRSAANSGTCRMYYGGTLNNSEKGLLTCTVTYTTPSVTTPSNFYITQSNDGTYTLSWSASAGSNGSGSVYYDLWALSDGTQMQFSTARSYTANIPGDYEYYYEWRVRAYYSGVYSSWVTLGYTFQPPSISGPSSITLSTTQAPSVTVSWPAAVLSYTNGDISYQVYYRKNGGNYVSVGSTTSTSKTFTETMLDEYGDDRDTFVFQVDAYGTNLTNNADGNHSSVSSGSPNSSTFTFYSPNTVAYHDGSSWQEAIVYYRDGTTWQECDAYYHDGTDWVLIKSKTS